MKRLRKHFMVLFLFMLFGAALLGMSSNGVFASAFGWISSAPANPAGASQSSTSSASSQETAAEADPQEADVQLYLTPVGAAGTISAKTESGTVPKDDSMDADSPADNGYTEIDSPVVSFSTVGSAAADSGGGISAKPVSVKQTNLDDSVSSRPEDGSTVSQPPAGTGGTSSESGDSTSSDSSDSDSSGSNSTSDETGGSWNHSGGNHHHRSVGITSVKLDKTELTLGKGESAALTATIAPSSTTQSKTISWSSSDPAVVTVDDSGKVTAMEGGTAVVTAKTSNGKTADCTVTVSIPATGISLSLSDTPVERGQTLKLTAKLTPFDSTNKVLWATSDNSIASVDSSGNVTGVSPGMAVIIAAAGDGSISASCEVTTVVSISQLVLSDETLTITKGEEHQLTAQVLPEDTTEDKTVTWSSSDPDVVTVDDAGKVTAVEGGTAIITAKTGTHSAQCTVTVTVPVTGITLDRTELTLARGTSDSLVPTIAPADATDKAVDWTSSDEMVATVDANGNITAVGAGTATITAITHDGEFTADCTVTVIVPVTGVSLDQTTLDLLKGGSAALTAIVSPSDATDPAVTWSSSDPAVVSVDNDGNIAATGGGTATVTVTTHDDGFTASCQVTVNVPVTGITLDRTKLTLARGTADSLVPTIAPADATDKAVDWTSSDEAVAMVDADGKITAVGVGMATITATTHDGEFTADCQVTVIVPVTGVSLDQTTLDLLKGGSAALTATVSPADATDPAVTWSSSDPAVVSVDNNGNIAATGGGTATVTVTTHDGGFTASCQVTVTVPVTGIHLNKASTMLLNRSSETLTPSFEPADATDQAVTWSSSDPTVATVDNTGKVTAVSTGKTAVITVTTHDGGYTASCTVSTAIPVTGISLNKTSLTIIQGDSATLTATVSPSDATNKVVTWSSSNTSILTVSSSGVTTSRKYGTATVTAKTKDGGFTATCQVTVKAAVQAKIVEGNSHWSGTINSNGSGRIMVRDRNTDGRTYRYSYIDFIFAKPVTYQATNWSDFDRGESSPQSVIKFANSTHYAGVNNVDTCMTLYAGNSSGGMARIGGLNSYKNGYPWFVWVSDDGLMINKSGQATHFRLGLSAELKATDANGNNDEAYVTWSKITFCGIPLTDIQVLS